MGLASSIINVMLYIAPGPGRLYRTSAGVRPTGVHVQTVATALRAGEVLQVPGDVHDVGPDPQQVFARLAQTHHRGGEWYSIVGSMRWNL